MVIGANEMVRGRLRRGVRTVGSVRRRFRKRGILGSKRAIYLVRGNMQKAEVGFLLLGQTCPIGSYLLQKRKCPVHIRTDEIIRPSNGAIDMALSRKMQDRPGLATRQQALHKGTVCDVAVHKLVLALVCDRLQVVKIPRVGKFVQIYDGN